jgi:hypothetical protein
MLPLELGRTNSLGYTVFDVQAMAQDEIRHPLQ